ncbi:hypothetical protein GCM10029976_042120 [Kribbella albertanoniae]
MRLAWFVTIGLSAAVAAMSAPPASGTTDRDGKVAFTSLTGTGPRIATVGTDGTGLAVTGVAGFDPTWSPDGSLLAFSRITNATTYQTDLFITRADGTGIRRLTESGGSAPEWSRDGSKIAFSRGPKLLVINASGTDERLVYDNADQDASWSADSSRIAFADRQGGLFTANVDGTELRRLAAGPSERPAFSPNGQRVAFVNPAVAPSSIVVVAADGTDLQRVPIGMSVTDLDWTPDGTQWVLQGQTHQSFLYTVNTDGTGLRRLTSSSTGESSPDVTDVRKDG